MDGVHLSAFLQTSATICCPNPSREDDFLFLHVVKVGEAPENLHGSEPVFSSKVYLAAFLTISPHVFTGKVKDSSKPLFRPKDLLWES